MASQGQINVVAPFELEPGTTVSLQLLYFGIPSAKIALQVVSTAPALFTQNGSGTGLVVVTNQDGSINKPSPAGSTVTLQGTGGGVVPGAVDGAIARSAANLSSTAQVSVAGLQAKVLYAGAAPGQVNGVFELQVKLPENLPHGAAPISVSIGGQTSPKGATLEIR